MEDSLKSLDQYRRMFADARDLLADNRREQQVDDDYYHGYQLTAKERAVLQKRKQPDTVFNRYRKAINGQLGVFEQGATDPRAYGRNPGIDEDSADVVTKTLRFAADLNDFDQIRLDCAYDYLVPGTCALLVEVDEERRPKLTKINWEEFFYDPRSRRRDFVDARYMGIAKWMYADDLAARHPAKAAEIEGALDTAMAIDDTFEDRPRDSLSNWVDRRKRRLMVVEIYHREGQGWMRCMFHAGGIVEAGPSPYNDGKRNPKPDCAIVAQACYIDRENNRIGVGRDMRSPQDEFNKRRQKLMHWLNNRQLQATDPQSFMPIDADLARAEAARPDGIFPPGWSLVPSNDVTSGQFNLLAMAETELDRQGPNPAVLGRQGEGASGRAQLVRQQAGLTEDAVVYKGIQSWELRVYRAIWNRCRQFWTAPDYIRVTEDEMAPQFIGINQPVTGEVPAIVQGPDGRPLAGTQTVILGYENALAELDVDITLDVVPDTANLAQEQFAALGELAKLYGPEEVPFDDMLELSNLPDKRKLIEKRKARAEQAGQQGQERDEIARAGAVAEVEKTQAEAALAGAKAETEMLKPRIEAAKAIFGSGMPATGA